tara:strand:+ start:14478 stop:15248 length:771 start_codon:yes stop_codon:yes gene_type:complete
MAEFPDMLEESSALALEDDVVWTLNDSGNEAVLFAVSLKGQMLAEIPILNARNIDWESLAQDESHFFVADTGNNLNSRDRLIIYRIPKPRLGLKDVTAELISIRYSGYESGNMSAHNFDAEALAVRGAELWLFSKNRGNGNSDLYRFPKSPGDYVVEATQSLPVQSLVTAADIHPGTSELVLISSRREDFGFQSLIWFAPTTDEGVDWEWHKSSQLSPTDQWEAVVWLDETEVLLSHERNARGFAGLGRFQKRSAN